MKYVMYEKMPRLSPAKLFRFTFLLAITVLAIASMVYVPRHRQVSLIEVDDFIASLFNIQFFGNVLLIFTAISFFQIQRNLSLTTFFS